jgi:predicted RNase H-like HicB family nuclease
MSARTHTYTAQIHEEDDGTFWAEVNDLPGCFASGDTLDELKDALEEAISLYRHDDPHGGRISRIGERSFEVDELRVRVAD